MTTEKSSPTPISIPQGAPVIAYSFGEILDTGKIFLSKRYRHDFGTRYSRVEYSPNDNLSFYNTLNHARLNQMNSKSSYVLFEHQVFGNVHKGDNDTIQSTKNTITQIIPLCHTCQAIPTTIREMGVLYFNSRKSNIHFYCERCRLSQTSLSSIEEIREVVQDIPENAIICQTIRDFTPTKIVFPGSVDNNKNFTAKAISDTDIAIGKTNIIPQNMVTTSTETEITNQKNSKETQEEDNIDKNVNYSKEYDMDNVINLLNKETSAKFFPVAQTGTNDNNKINNVR